MLCQLSFVNAIEFVQGVQKRYKASLYRLERPTIALLSQKSSFWVRSNALSTRVENNQREVPP